MALLDQPLKPVEPLRKEAASPVRYLLGKGNALARTAATYSIPTAGLAVLGAKIRSDKEEQRFEDFLAKRVDEDTIKAYKRARERGIPFEALGEKPKTELLSAVQEWVKTGKKERVAGEIGKTVIPPGVDVLAGSKAVKESIADKVPESVKEAAAATGRAIGKVIPTMEPGEGDYGVQLELKPGDEEAKTTSKVGVSTYAGGRGDTTSRIGQTSDKDRLIGLQVSKDTANIAVPMSLIPGTLAAVFNKRLKGRRLNPIQYGAHLMAGTDPKGLRRIPAWLAGNPKTPGRLKAFALGSGATLGGAYVLDKAMLAEKRKGAPHLKALATKSYKEATDRLRAVKDAIRVRDTKSKGAEYNYSPLVASLVSGAIGGSLGYYVSDKDKLLWSTLGTLGGSALPYVIHALQSRIKPKEYPYEENADALRRASITRRRSAGMAGIEPVPLSKLDKPKEEEPKKELQKKSYDWKGAAEGAANFAKDYRYEIGSGIAGAGSVFMALKAIHDRENRLSWAAGSAGLGGVSALLAYLKHRKAYPKLDVSAAAAGNYGEHPWLNRVMQGKALLGNQGALQGLTPDKVNEALWEVDKLRTLPPEQAKIEGRKLLKQKFPDMDISPTFQDLMMQEDYKIGRDLSRVATGLNKEVEQTLDEADKAAKEMAETRKTPDPQELLRQRHATAKERGYYVINGQRVPYDPDNLPKF